MLCATLLGLVLAAPAPAQEKNAAYWEKVLLAEDWRKLNSKEFGRGTVFLANEKETASLVKVLYRYDNLVKKLAKEEKTTPKSKQTEEIEVDNGNDSHIAWRKRSTILVSMRFLCTPELGKKHPEIAVMYASRLKFPGNDFEIGCVFLALRNLGDSAKHVLPQLREWIDSNENATRFEEAKELVKKLEGK